MGWRPSGHRLRIAHRVLAYDLRVDAGLVNACREYAVAADSGKDPFHALPKEVRKVALGRYGFDLDLKAAHPHVKLSMVQPGRAASTHFLQHRDEILYAIGRRFFPTLTREQHKDKAKMLFSAIDMDGSPQGFLDRQHLPRVHLSAFNATAG